MLEEGIVICCRAPVERRFIPVLGCALAIAAIGWAGGARADAASDAQMAAVYARAAQSGDEVAEFYLGALASAGVGRPQSDADAVQWFTQAANQGHAHAMVILSAMLAIGRGAPRDYVTSYKWAYIVSVASQTDEFRNGAKQLIGLIEPKMTPPQIAEAKSQAANFHAGNASTAVSQPVAVPSLPVVTAPGVPPLPTAAGSNPPPAVSALPMATAPGFTPPPAQAPSNPQPAAAAPSPKPAAQPSAANNARAHDVVKNLPPDMRNNIPSQLLRQFNQ